jgi:membrane fusion protein (multidrug efflux system)
VTRPVKPVLRYILFAAIAAAVLGAVAAPKVLPLLSASAGADKGKTAAPARSGRSPSAAVAVTTFTIVPTKLTESVTSTGTLLAEEGVELQAEINGKIVSIHFTEGVRVRKGDLLVKLNDADLVATQARAKYRKELSVLRERRLAQLLKQGVVGREEYDTALNELNVQNAEIALIEAQVAKTEVRAPFDGVVGLRYVSEGAFVNAATRVATLQRLERLKVDFSVPEKYAMRVRPGAPIRFTVAGADHKFSGQIYAVDPRIDTATRTVVIRALCPNPGMRLLPGAFASVELQLSELDGAIMVPATAVVPGLNEMTVFVVKDGKAERRAVETGTRLENSVHILSGLAPGDVVITSGLTQMRPGQAVRPLGDASGDGAT